MIRRFRNFVGKVRGFSCCLNCGDRWNWKHGHMVGCSDERNITGMSPVCHQCFEKLSPEAIFDFATELLSRWIAQSPKDYPEDVVASMLESIRKSIEIEKRAGISPQATYYTPLHTTYYRALCQRMEDRIGPVRSGRRAYVLTLLFGLFSGLFALITGILGHPGGYGAALVFFAVSIFALIRFRCLWKA